jgi:branched-chain amino acid transport system permease protein
VSTNGTVRRRTGLWHNEDARRLVACLATGVLVALVTGADGTEDDYLLAFRKSLLSIRLPICLVLGLLLWTLMYLAGRGRLSGSPAAASETVRARIRAVPGLHRVLVGLVVVVAVALPPFLSGFWQDVLVNQTGIYVLLAAGLNVVVGWAGLLDLGYIAFFAIGAYTTAYLTDRLPVHPPVTVNPFVAIVFAVLACLVAGVLLGTPTLRLRGDYLAIVTLGFGEIVRITALNLDDVTNGSRGATNIPHFSLGSLHWGIESLPYWYLLLVFVAVVVLLFNRLEHTRIGRAWAAIREDEVAAQANGVRPVRMKLLAFAIGASTSGVAGVLYASKIGFINPDNFILQYSVFVLAYVIFGGMGSLTGVILGAAFLTVLPEFLRDYVPPADRPIYLGAVLVVMMIFRPAGLVPARRRRMELEAHEVPEAGTAAPAPAGAMGGVEK